MDEWEQEVDRQKLLAAVGLLRRFDGRTWGWSMAVRTNEDKSKDEQVWLWRTSGGYSESKHMGIEDFERAWADVVASRRLLS